MLRLFKFHIATLLLLLVCASCNFVSSVNPSDAEDVANAFAESYFNLRYKNSLK
jgi:hypothetical protein